MKIIKVLTVFGTRPEAIKMIPLLKEMEKSPKQIESVLAVTGQHRQMLDQILEDFSICPDYDLDIMQVGQTLEEMTSKILAALPPILQQEKPDVVLVHGDTTSSFAAALAAFYQKVPVGHVEAGLRTWDKYSPFPEELNRQLIDTIADLFFAPTEVSRANLLLENHAAQDIIVTGNTAIDMMHYTLSSTYQSPLLEQLKSKKQMVLFTMHRRENLGQPMTQVFRAIQRLTREFPSLEFVFPMHKNPEVRRLAKELLDDNPQVHLIEPLDVRAFHNIAGRSCLILTDSGGVQEEAPSLGVPVLVLRETTERPEGVEAGTLRLVGTQEEGVFQAVKELLTNREAYRAMAQARNPYGDGDASSRIVSALLERFS